MLVDLAINGFDADVAEMATLAGEAEALGYSGVWVADHFSGAVVGRRWSRDPFVCLAAMATATRRIDLGLLVANVRNRHPAQLASAVNSLQSLAPGRIRLGVGSGAAPGSPFAVEHEAIGTPLGSAEERRTRLVDSISALRAIWSGAQRFEGVAGTGFAALAAVVDGAPCPPIIVGASAWPTIELAMTHADGVNVRRTPQAPPLLTRVLRERRTGFELSLLDAFDDAVAAPGLIDEARADGVDRLVLGISPPHDVARLRLLSW